MLTLGEFGILAILAIAILWMGLYPQPVIEVMHASIVNLIRAVSYN